MSKECLEHGKKKKCIIEKQNKDMDTFEVNKEGKYHIKGIPEITWMFDRHPVNREDAKNMFIERVKNNFLKNNV